MSPPSLTQPFVNGSLETTLGTVPRISPVLTPKDRLGTVKARWGIGRMHYAVDPGLYALGNPGTDAPVLVTANYKMSFDRLRKVLVGLNAWILVLDTKGINVWCAAGKGSFGTEELIGRIQSSGLARVITHRHLILPQLGAPGVSAHMVRKLSGFKVIYGPIRAEDLPAFLDARLKATPEMRRKTFPISERAVLIPIELVSALKIGIFLFPAFFFLAGFGGSESFWNEALHAGGFSIMTLLTAIVSGTILGPLLLPWLPGRAFSLKGLFLGLMTTLFVLSCPRFDAAHISSSLEMIAWFFIIPTVTAYLVMNFTGASTYTSLSGVRKEMRWALPLQIGAGAVGVLLWLWSRFMS